MSSVSNFFKSLLHLYESNSSLVLPLVYPLPDLALSFSFPFFLRIKLMGSMIGLSQHVFHGGIVGLHDLLCKIACQLFLFLGFAFSRKKLLVNLMHRFIFFLFNSSPHFYYN